jgi:hypothetical protein
VWVGGKFQYPFILNPPSNAGYGHIIGMPDNDFPNSAQRFQSASARAVNVQTENYNGQGIYCSVWVQYRGYRQQISHGLGHAMPFAMALIVQSK